MIVTQDFEFGCGVYTAWQLECGNFLDAWLDTAGTPHITLVAISSAGTVARTFDGPGDALVWVEAQQNRGRNVYFQTNETRPGCVKKPTKSEIVAVACRHSDIDPLDDEYPFADERARLLKLADKLAADPGVAPTFVIDSGNGIQCVWVTERELNSAAVTERVESENRAIDNALGGDAVHNVDRLLRLPGTLNFPTQNEAGEGAAGCPRASAVPRGSGLHRRRGRRAGCPDRTCGGWHGSGARGRRRGSGCGGASGGR